MVCYLNRGLILEQAVVAMIRDYLQTIDVNSIYSQNQIHAVLNNHFAKLYRENGDKAADSFPAVVISSFDDDKDRELNAVRPQTQGAECALIGYGKSDIEQIMDIYEPEIKDGKETGKKVRIPGVCAVLSDKALAAIMAKFEKPENEDDDGKERLVYGYSVRAYRKEIISIDIWAENIQLKNELYEQIRLFVLGDLRNKLIDKYKFFDPRIDDDNVRGQRVLPFLIDFGLTLAGANVQFEATYAVEQNVIDTDLDGVPREITIGGRNYVY